jgi:hypothetical protein
MQDGQNNYDFITNNQAEPARASLLPNLSNPLKLIAGIVVLTLLIAIVGAVLGGKNNKVGNLTDVIGRAQEMSRVSALETPLLKDSGAIAVSATSQSILANDQAQLKKYASAHKIKINSKKLLTYKNASTDELLTKAASNGSLDSVYEAYLHDSLVDYMATLSAAFTNSKDAGLKSRLQSSYASVKTLLSAEPLKSTP